MDLEMPGMDGLEASRRIRARPWGSSVLIAALTGWGQDVDRRRAQEAGVDLYFVNGRRAPRSAHEPGPALRRIPGTSAQLVLRRAAL